MYDCSLEGELNIYEGLLIISFYPHYLTFFKLHLMILLIASIVISFQSAHIFTFIPPATFLETSHSLSFTAVQLQRESMGVFTMGRSPDPNPIRFLKLYCKYISGLKAQPQDLQTSGNTNVVCWWQETIPLLRFYLVFRQSLTKCGVLDLKVTKTEVLSKSIFFLHKYKNLQHTKTYVGKMYLHKLTPTLIRL